MIQFLLALLRNPLFLLGIGAFIGFWIYYNRLLREYTALQSQLEQLGNTLTQRHQLVRIVVNPDGNSMINKRLDQLEMPAAIPMLRDDLALRFEEERALGEDIDDLIWEMDADKTAAQDPSFQEWRNKIREANQQIVEARSSYNDQARAFNLRISTFPGALIATLVGIHEQKLFV